MGPLIAAGAVLSQSYADDLQAYVHCSAAQAISAVETMSQAIETFQGWVSSNRLLLSQSINQYSFYYSKKQQLTQPQLKYTAATEAAT